MHSHRLLGHRHPGKLLLLAAVLGFAAVSAGCAVSKLKTASELAKKSEPFQARPAGAVHRLLVVGDSTAVGTGASSPATSVAGLIAREHPDWAVTNRASDGAKFADIPAQLAAGGSFDTVLVLCGGNDVIRMTGGDKLRADVRQVADEAKRLAPRVILMPPGNVGNAPFFFAPVSWLMSSRAREMHAAVREAAAASGAAYVNLYQDKENDPFAQDPERMNAADGLHPSDAGYVLWRQTLKAQAGL